jgi:PDZ domain-containing protein GIPC
MPLFNKKNSKINNAPITPNSPSIPYDNNNTKPSAPPYDQNSPAPAAMPNNPESNVTKPQLVFHCQLAHGSPTGLITGFSSVKELYTKIAECYDFPVEEVSLYCILLIFILISIGVFRYRIIQACIKKLHTRLLCKIVQI